MKKVYGIDLGTTYSAISFVNEDGKAELINNTDGLPITASAVYFESPGNIVVGETAKEQRKIDSSRVVDLIKREMGADWRRSFDDKEYTPESISALILGCLVKGAAQAGHTVEDVVITCPAYFGEKEREATYEAGVIAGLNVLQIIDEPIAAVWGYGINLDTEEPRHVVVYDLGGNTFDVTILRIHSQGVDVLHSDGDHRLGGADWDNRLESLLAGKFMEACPSADNPQDDVDSRYELRNQTERVKKKLSNALETSIAISHNGKKAKVLISRQEFEDNTQDLLKKTIYFTDNLLAIAKEKHGVEKIDDFLLVGGSTYMPQVSGIINARYKDTLGIEPKIFEPNYVVAKGAALYSSQIKKHLPEREPERGAEEFFPDHFSWPHDYPSPAPSLPPFTLPTKIKPTHECVLAKSFGIKTLDITDEEVCYNMLKKGMVAPHSETLRLPTAEGGAERIYLTVYSNDADDTQVDIDYCEELGTLSIAASSYSSFDITLGMTEAGLLSIEAHDLTSNTKTILSIPCPDSIIKRSINRKKLFVGELTIE